jgi:hypothetical protein
MVENVAAGVVDVVGGEKFVTGLQWERPNHCVDRGRGVGDESERFGSCSQDPGQDPARFVDGRLPSIDDEVRRVLLEATPPFRLGIEDGEWGCPKRTMIEMEDLRIQQPGGIDHGGAWYG